METEQVAVIGLKDAKNTIDNFVSLAGKNRRVVESFTHAELVNIVLHNAYPVEFKSKVCMEFFGIDYIRTIKEFRLNPASLMLRLTAPR